MCHQLVVPYFLYAKGAFLHPRPAHKMAYLLLLHDVADHVPQREHIFHAHADLFAKSNEYLHIWCFRLPRPVLEDLCNYLDPALQSHTQRSNPVPPYAQVLSTLGFLSTGTFQLELGDRVGISKLPISHTLLRVVGAINQLATQYKFPHTAEEQVTVKRGLNSVAGLPKAISAIDCTHMRIKAPSPDPFPYLNHKQYHSINVQLISQNHLLNVVSRFTAGAHGPSSYRTVLWASALNKE